MGLDLANRFGHMSHVDFRAQQHRMVQDDAAVRAQAAVSLGRMKVKESAPELRRIYQDQAELPRVRRACAWALGRITGKAVPALKLPVQFEPHRAKIEAALPPLGLDEGAAKEERS